MPLSALEIDAVVERYLREMARYEEVARVVEDRLRRATRANALRVMLSARAKHPEDLRKKLELKKDDPRYERQALERALDRVVTDLAGCRVMAYRPTDVPSIERAVLETFELADVERARERHEKPSGYRATHLLVSIGASEERLSIRGTTCEVQITSIAAHVFNELEHDIGYKDHDVPPTEAERRALDELLHAVRLVDPSVERLASARADSIQRQTVALRDAEELKYVLERDAGRPLHGEFNRLFRMLGAVNEFLTPAAVLAFGNAKELLEKGGAAASNLGIADADDVVRIALALFEHFPEEFKQLVQEQRGPATLLKKAVLSAADARQT